ncbi:MAG: IPT/TIG domain-containing protein, partial [Dehalococcoidia bacterium]|nr:IPT/TIG domain-containing protein [Dehalococcoidia bacterium]
MYYKRSTDGGANWGADTRLTNDAGSSLTPSIAVSGNNVHVSWQDNRDGNWEIYYKRDTAPAPTITSFSPIAGNPGTTVVITGANFTGATAVAFGGVPASGFTVDSDTQITAIVGNGLPGRITVTTPSGTGTSTGIFNFMNLAGGTPHGSSVSGGTTTASQQGPVP